MPHRAAFALAACLGLVCDFGCSESDGFHAAADAENSDLENQGVRAGDENVSRSPGAKQPVAAGELQELAEQGDAEAQRLLAARYFRGDGVPKDAALAAEWFHKAGEQGDPKAQTLLAAMYTLGDGVPKDATQAVDWYRKAAEQGFAPAQVGLGSKYAQGEGVPKNLVEAHKWTNLAASSGDSEALDRLDELEENMTNQERADAEKLAREWFEAHRQENE